MTAISLSELVKAHDEAVKNKQEKFMLKGLEFMTKYAKYLIEHLTNVYKKKSMRKTDKIEFTEKHEGDKNG